MMRASSARIAQARAIRKVRRLRPKYDRDRGRTALNFSSNTVLPPARLSVCDVVAVAPTLYVCTALESHSGRMIVVGGGSGAVRAGTDTCVDIAGVLLVSSLSLFKSSRNVLQTRNARGNA
jgi:hypothetical protein